MHLTVGIPSPMVITARHLVKRAPISTYSSSLSRSPSSPCVYFSPEARGRSTVLLSTLMPGTTPCLSRTCGSGVPSEDSWRMVSSKRITPERYSPMPPVVKSISLYCRRLSSVESMSTALKRFSMVPKLSSAARMPLPSGTSSLAVLSSCCKCMISPLFSFLPQGQLLAKRITNVPCSVAGSLLVGWVESSSRTRFSPGRPPLSPRDEGPRDSIPGPRPTRLWRLLSLYERLLSLRGLFAGLPSALLLVPAARVLFTPLAGLLFFLTVLSVGVAHGHYLLREAYYVLR